MMGTATAQGSTTADELLASARDLEFECSQVTDHRLWLQLRRAAAQLRFTAATYQQGTCPQDVAEAFITAATTVGDESFLARIRGAR